MEKNPVSTLDEAIDEMLEDLADVYEAYTLAQYKPDEYAKSHYVEEYGEDAYDVETFAHDMVFDYEVRTWPKVKYDFEEAEWEAPKNGPVDEHRMIMNYGGGGVNVVVLGDMHGGTPYVIAISEGKGTCRYPFGRELEAVEWLLGRHAC